MPHHDTVHTLADLANWQASGPCLAVLGHPISHSLSPVMHHAALAELAAKEPAFARWRYFKFDLLPETLGEALNLFFEKGFVGLNLTIPHKVVAVPLMQRIDADAATAGAVNTLRRFAAGYEGFNTDGYGISHAVREAFHREISDGPVILLGAGGAARATAVTCLQEGCRGLWIGNRTRSNLDQLLGILAPTARDQKVEMRGFSFDDPSIRFPAGALVINATSAGLKPTDAVPIDLSRLTGDACVYDMVYNPPETALLRQAHALGLRCANGLSMLAHQGARALELWTGRTVSAATMFDACRTALAGC